MSNQSCRTPDDQVVCRHLKTVVQYLQIQQRASRSQTQRSNRCVIASADHFGDDFTMLGDVLIPMASATIAEISLAKIL